jgi:hypothetical protein
MLRHLVPLLLWPLGFFEGNGAPGAGDGDAGGNAGAGSGAGDAPPAGQQQQRSGEPLIPKSRLDEVLAENRRLKAAEEERERKSLEAKGQHEQIAAKEKARAETAIAQLKETKLQAAFVMAASGKVNDVEAAWALADTSSITVSDEGKISGDIDAVIAKAVEKYPMLKGQPSRRTDESVNGAGGNPPDVSKLTAAQKIERGLTEQIAQLPPQKQGLFRT